MTIGRYLFNLLKVENRKLATQCGGHPEVPTSARIGYLAYNHDYWWLPFAVWVLGKMFDDPLHAAIAFRKEDDDMTKYVSDPEGKYFVPLFIFWILERLAVLGCIGYTIYSFAPMVLGVPSE